MTVRKKGEGAELLPEQFCGKGRLGIPLYQTGGYRVTPAAVNKVKQAIKEFVAYVQANESGTVMYLAWQGKSDPTRFLHLVHLRRQGRANPGWSVRRRETF